MTVKNVTPCFPCLDKLKSGISVFLSSRYYIKKSLEEPLWNEFPAGIVSGIIVAVILIVNRGKEIIAADR